MTIRLRRRPARAAALASSIAPALSAAVAAPAYADTHGKIYSLVSTPADCMAITMVPDYFNRELYTTGCVNNDEQQYSYVTGNETSTSGYAGAGCTSSRWSPKAPATAPRWESAQRPAPVGCHATDHQSPISALLKSNRSRSNVHATSARPW
jgi:hypothetical protein